jgi:hypothetical protein
MMQFTHPLNQHRATVRAPRFWTLLFGPLYFASHGAWGQALISFVMAVCTVGVSWLVYPFFAPRIVRSAYLTQGWQEAGPASTA